MDWYKIQINWDDYRKGDYLKFAGIIIDIVYQMAASKQDFEKLAVFITKNPRPPHCDLFFSPPCMPHIKPFMDKFQGVACAKPKKQDLALLAGDDRAWDFFD